MKLRKGLPLWIQQIKVRANIHTWRKPGTGVTLPRSDWPTKITLRRSESSRRNLPQCLSLLSSVFMIQKQKRDWPKRSSIGRVPRWKKKQKDSSHICHPLDWWDRSWSFWKSLVKCTWFMQPNNDPEMTWNTPGSPSLTPPPKKIKQNKKKGRFEILLNTFK